MKIEHGNAADRQKKKKRKKERKKEEKKEEEEAGRNWRWVKWSNDLRGIKDKKGIGDGQIER